VNKLPSASWRSLLTDLLLGAGWGALLASLAKGVHIGWQSRDAGWGWLSVPLGLVSGPVYLIMDLYMLLVPGEHAWLVLDWAVMGALIGAALGLLPGEGLAALDQRIDKDKQ